MVGDIFQPTHLLFILVVALLVLGPKRLPEVGRTLGSGIRDFRQAISGESSSDHDSHSSWMQSTTEPEAELRHQPEVEPEPAAAGPAPAVAPSEPAPADIPPAPAVTPADAELDASAPPAADPGTPAADVAPRATSPDA